MKSIALSFLLLSIVYYLNAQDIDFQWAAHISSNQNNYTKSVVSDDSGNVYVTGQFGGSVDFDPDTGTYYLSSNGGADVFIEKFDVSGKMIWAKSVGGLSDEDAPSIELDQNGNVYVTGMYQYTVDFNPDTTTAFNQTSVGSSDGFVLKLKNNGDFVWVKIIGGVQGDNANVVEYDGSGNLIVAGVFKDSCDMDPGVNVYKLYSAGGGTDIFVLKLDTAGNFVWAKDMGGVLNDKANDVAVDLSGNIYVAGTFFGSGDFDPHSTNTYTLTAVGNADYFIEKLSSAGTFLWAYSFGMLNSDEALTIVSNSIDVFIAGNFRGNVDFDPDTSSFVIVPTGIANAFIQKFDTSGKFIWAKAFNGYYASQISSAHIGYSGNLYLTGNYTGTIDFDPDTSTYNLTTVGSGSSDFFIQNMDTSGNMMWTISIGGPTYDVGYDITTNVLGNIINAGSFTSTVDFDPDTADTYNLTSISWIHDAYVLSLKECLTDSVIDSIFTCKSSFTWIDSITYTQSNDTAIYLTQNIRGCDSVAILKLTIEPEYGIDVIDTCSAYTWIDSITYTSSNNTATYTLNTASGCDSIVQLDLTINSIVVTDKISSCTPITWIDSVTYTSSTNIPQVTFTNAAGCDSIVKLDLTITKPNINVLVSEPKLTSQASASLYQWLDCNDNFSPIQGAVGKTFTPVKNGLYAVEVQKNSCIDTSECYAITTIGLIKINSEFFINIYPNPGDGHFYIELLNSKNTNIKVFNASGSLIEKLDNLQEGRHQLNIEGAKGLYIIEVTSEAGIQHFELIKE